MSDRTALDEVLAGARTVHLQPDDVLVIKLATMWISPEQMEALRAALPEGRTVLILTPDAALGTAKQHIRDLL